MPDFVLSSGVHDRWTELQRFSMTDLESKMLKHVDTPPAMPPAFCLTCDPARSAIAQQHFADRSLDVTFVQAVHGDRWGLASTLVYEPHRDPNYRIHPKHVGINLSHWMLWQHLQLAGIEQALILEDDAELVPDFATKLPQAMGQLPADWQFVFAGYLEDAKTVGRKTTQRLSPAVIRTRELFGTHCYLVRRSALPILLETSQLAWAPIDIQIEKHSLPRLAHYTLSAPLAVQRIEPQAKRAEAIRAAQKLEGWCHEEKMGYLYDVCLGKRTFVEVGVFGGRSFLPAALAIGSEGTAYAIDAWSVAAAIDGLTPEHTQWWSSNAGLEKRYQEFTAAIERHGIATQTRVMRMESMQAAALMDDGSVEVLHIDGNHPKALEDFKAWLPKLKAGGILVVDDTENAGWPEVDAALPWVRERCREVHAGHMYRAFEKLSRDAADVRTLAPAT